MNLAPYQPDLPSFIPAPLGPVTGHWLLLAPVTIAVSCPSKLVPSSWPKVPGPQGLFRPLMPPGLSHSSYLLKVCVCLIKLEAQFDSIILLKKTKCIVYFVFFFCLF